MYNPANSRIICTFVIHTEGLYGFDGKMKWYVSMRRLDGYLLNLSGQRINWRKQLRSRCLTEVQ